MSFWCRARNALSQATQLLANPNFAAPAERQTLLRFSDSAVRESFVIQTDYSIGGFSKCDLNPSRAGMVWSGATALEADPIRQKTVPKSDQKKNASRVGFVAMRADVEDLGWELHDFHGLTLRGRFPDDRKYVMNLRTAAVLDDCRLDDLYQVGIFPFLRHAKPAAMDDTGRLHGSDSSLDLTAAEHSAGSASDLATAAAGAGSAAESEGIGVASTSQVVATNEAPLVDVRIPWCAFQLTWRGYLQFDRPPAMHLGKITHLGFLLADAPAAGPFSVELSSLSAFRYTVEEERSDAYVREQLTRNRDLGYEEFAGY